MLHVKHTDKKIELFVIPDWKQIVLVLVLLALTLVYHNYFDQFRKAIPYLSLFFVILIYLLMFIMSNSKRLSYVFGEKVLRIYSPLIPFYYRSVNIETGNIQAQFKKQIKAKEEYVDNYETLELSLKIDDKTYRIDSFFSDQVMFERIEKRMADFLKNVLSEERHFEPKQKENLFLTAASKMLSLRRQ